MSIQETETLNERLNDLTQRVHDLQMLLDDTKGMVAGLNESFGKLSAQVAAFELKVAEDINAQIHLANEEIKRANALQATLREASAMLKHEASRLSSQVSEAALEAVSRKPAAPVRKAFVSHDHNHVAGNPKK